MDKNYLYSKGGANVSVIKLDAVHCYLCGESFTKTKVKTKHHSIPDEFNPVRNVIVPVCKDCHLIIHNGKSFEPKERNKLIRITKGMKNQFDLLAPKIDLMLDELKVKKNESNTNTQS